MKIAIKHEDLQKALNVVAGVVPAKTAMPILTCILMETEEDGVRLSATDLDVSVSTLARGASVKRKGRVAVPAAKFIAFVRSLSPGEVAIEEKSGKIVVTAGKSGLEEPGMNPDEFPALPVLEQSKGTEVPAETICGMVRSTSYAVSRDETRPPLMGILWEVRPDSLRLVATDAHRLARVESHLKLGVREQRSLIADTRGLQQLVRLAEEAQAVTVHLGNNQLSFGIGDTLLHIRLLEGPFPDYEAVIPRSNNKTVVADRETFIQAVRRVSITADRITSQIRLGVESGRMELTGTGSDGSRAEDEIPVSYEGDAIEIGFNYNYLLDILKNISSETIQVAVKDAQSAALITPSGEEKGDQDLLCLLMPLRLSAE